MSADSSNINPLNTGPANMDFSVLRDTAIKFLQQHNKELWTDYNYHDPGVTILEQLCFAITDLAYRTDFPMEELLQKQGSQESHIFPASLRLLNTFPVRKIDIRKVILDSLPAGGDGKLSNKIYNAWVAQAPNGTYAVDVQLTTLSYKEIEKSDSDFDTGKKVLEKEIKQALGGFRGICTDFGVINILKKDEIVVTGNVNIKNGYEAERVLADIYTRIDAYINPAVPFYTLDELLAKNIPVAKIFEGPALNKGFVLDTDLQAPNADPDTSKPRLIEIDISEIESIIFSTAGVSGIGNIMINDKRDKYPLGGSIEANGNYFPLLKTDLIAGKILTLSKNGAKVDIGSLNKLKYNTYLSELNPKRTKPATDQQPKDNFEKEGKFRDLAKYYSIQKYFPMVYGIGDYGLPDKVFVNEQGTNTVQSLNVRKAQAKQLKAYLMLFEQILANYLSQLANIDNLFSTEYGHRGRTYFYHALVDDPLCPKSNNTNVPGGSDIIDEWKKYHSDLKINAEDDSTYVERKGKFQDHLLARVNETMDAYPFRLYDLVYTGVPTTETRQSKLLKAKAAFLTMYYTIGYDRNKAFNYYSESLDSSNISGLELKIAVLLGIDNYQKRELHKIDKLVIHEGSKSQERPKSDRAGKAYEEIIIDVEETERFITDNGIVVEYTEDDEIIIEEGGGRHSKNDGKGFHFKNAGSIGLNAFFKNGMARSNYRIAKHKNPKNKHEYYITFFDISGKNDPKDRHWIKIHTHTSSEKASAKLDDLIGYAAEVNINAEGFHLVEHLLLRDDDPYQVSVVLPLWPARFQDSGFQDYFQQLFIKHAPLYIKSNFIWLDFVYMKEFENIYFPWLKSLVKNGPKANSESGKELINFLKEHSGNNKVEA
jgi:hypothetical protein